MKFPLLFAACSLCLAAPVFAQDAGFVSLFNGKDLTGWKSSEPQHASSFKVQDGMIIVNGEMAHLFYEGEDGKEPQFKNFILRAKVKTEPHANSGIYFHTKYQDHGWPSHGYEAQVNATHEDRRKTGGLYAVADIMDFAPNTDGEWFDYEIKVEGKTITLTVTPEKGPSFLDPIHRGPPTGRGRIRGCPAGSSRTAHLPSRAHDPGSTVYFKDIEVRKLD